MINSTISLYSFLEIPLFLQLFNIFKLFDKESLRDALDPLYQAGIHGKLYQLWYEFNRRNEIQVQTGCGVSNKIETGENITQGSVGSGLISALNLDDGVHASSPYSSKIMWAGYAHLLRQPRMAMIKWPQLSV